MYRERFSTVEDIPHRPTASKSAMEFVNLPDLTTASHPLDFPSKK